jgi:REP element-mobilizing transposase RayT
MRLNEWGLIARTEWLKSALIRSEIALDEFAVMPNHMHAIIIILECNGGFVGAQRLPSRSAQVPGSSDLCEYEAGDAAPLRRRRRFIRYPLSSPGQSAQSSARTNPP